jgi:hypothetical protein
VVLENKLYVYKAGFGSTITDIEVREGYDHADIREKVLYTPAKSRPIPNGHVIGTQRMLRTFSISSSNSSELTLR